MKLYLFLLILFIPFGFLKAQNRLERKLIRSVKKESVFHGAQVSISIFDLNRKKKRVSIQPNKNFLPASTLKLITFSGALKAFGKSLPILHYKKNKGRFYFWSTGYPLLVHPRYQEDALVSFLKSQKDSLYYIARPMTSPALGRGWAWDDVPYTFSAKKSSFPIHGNTVQVISDSESDSLCFYPAVLKNQIDINKGESSYALYINEHTYFLNRKANDTLYIPIEPSESQFIETLQDVIKRPIYIDSNQTIAFTDYKTLTTTSTQIHKELLYNSDNLVAESLLLMFSGIDQWELNTEKGISFIRDQNMPSAFDGVYVDGSGLSRYNLIKSTDLIVFLGNLYEKIGGLGVQAYLPRANIDGTLKSYAPKIPLHYVYAKSGSLRNQHVLAGYMLSNSYRAHAFVISVNNYIGEKRKVQAAIGRQLKLIHDRL